MSHEFRKRRYDVVSVTIRSMDFVLYDVLILPPITLMIYESDRIIIIIQREIIPSVHIVVLTT